MSTRPELPRSLLVLGSGELGKELVSAAQSLGLHVTALDRYDGAPAMQVADDRVVVDMDDPDAVLAAIRSRKPDHVVLELDSVRLDRLRELEEDGIRVVPSGEAVALATDREALRRCADTELELRVPRYTFAESVSELGAACDRIGYPCVVKAIRSISGRGQSTITGPARLEQAWHFATEGDDGARVIVEERIDFQAEVTILAVREQDGHTHFIRPIAHRQEQGSYRESWIPFALPEPLLARAHDMAERITTRLGGVGVFGVEFFVTDDAVIFSEVSPGPHDTGLVTLVSQDLSQFELHLRAMLGLPIPAIRYLGPSASAVILARGDGRVRGYDGLDRALLVESAQVRLFGKPDAHPLRRMGVALASGDGVAEARARALEAASRVDVRVG